MEAETEPVSLSTIAKAHKLSVKEFEKQYKYHLSGFKEWEQKAHADKWIMFPQNIGRHLSIDEVAVTNGELYTVITHKAAHGKKGALIAMIEGTKVCDVAIILTKIPLQMRNVVTEVTLDMAENMEAIVRELFPRARVVTDRFHVQQLVSDALQEVRIELRRKVIKEEDEALKEALKNKRRYIARIYENGDTGKQLLARSRYLLFKPSNKWTEQQRERAEILFREHPILETGYKLSMMFRSCYEYSKDIQEGKSRLSRWYQKVEEKGIDSFITASQTIRLHEDTILNYFINRSTNAGAESFNAKLKNFRTVVRGVRDKKFHLFRIAMLYG